MPTMKDFERLIGAWHGEGEIPAQPPMKVSSDATIERFGDFILFRSVGHPAEMPDETSASMNWNAGSESGTSLNDGNPAGLTCSR